VRQQLEVMLAAEGAARTDARNGFRASDQQHNGCRRKLFPLFFTFFDSGQTGAGGS
jgi:hypothetical protein